MGRNGALFGLVVTLALAACTPRPQPEVVIQDLAPVPSSPTPTAEPTSPAQPGRFVSSLGHLTFQHPHGMVRTEMGPNHGFTAQAGVVLTDADANLSISVIITAFGVSDLPPPHRCDGGVNPPEPNTGGRPTRCRYRDIGDHLWVETETTNESGEPSYGYMATSGGFEYGVYITALRPDQVERIVRTFRIDVLKAVCKPYDWIERPGLCDGTDEA